RLQHGFGRDGRIGAKQRENPVSPGLGSQGLSVAAPVEAVGHMVFVTADNFLKRGPASRPMPSDLHVCLQSQIKQSTNSIVLENAFGRLQDLPRRLRW